MVRLATSSPIYTIEFPYLFISVKNLIINTLYAGAKALTLSFMLYKIPVQ